MFCRTCVVAMWLAASIVGVQQARGDEYEDAFRDYVKAFGKTYASVQEITHRFEVFKDNYIFIAKENAKGTNTYELGVNQFTDLTNEEFSQSGHHGFQQASTMHATLGVHEHNSAATLPTSVDWRAKGAVTPVKDQSHCGSCWTFSATGALEGAWFIKKGTLVSLSEEMILECDHAPDAQACKGGDMAQALAFAEGGICTEDSYPYTAFNKVVAPCRPNYATNCTVGIPKGGVAGVKIVAQTEAALMSAIAQQPVSIAVQANQPIFQHYRGGIISAGCGTQLDHGILAVGYGTDPATGADYWLVKNSWATRWGEAGYGRLARGVNQTGGECGILMQASYPVMAASSTIVV